MKRANLNNQITTVRRRKSHSEHEVHQAESSKCDKPKIQAILTTSWKRPGARVNSAGLGQPLYQNFAEGHLGIVQQVEMPHNRCYLSSKQDIRQPDGGETLIRPLQRHRSSTSNSASRDLQSNRTGHQFCVAVGKRQHLSFHYSHRRRSQHISFGAVIAAPAILKSSSVTVLRGCQPHGSGDKVHLSWCGGEVKVSVGTRPKKRHISS